jgi:hypothetical protein
VGKGILGRTLLYSIVAVLVLAGAACRSTAPTSGRTGDVVQEPYLLDTGLVQIAWQKGGLAETQDDWSTATFWYEPVPSAPLPALPDLAARTADIWQPVK